MTKDDLTVLELLLKNAEKKIKYSDSAETVLKAASFNLALGEAIRLITAYGEGHIEPAVITALREKYNG